MDVASAGIKTFYTDYHDCIAQKRYNSPYWLRRYAHRRTHEAFFDYLEPGQQVLDAGCGEGVLTCLAARRGVDIIGADISGLLMSTSKGSGLSLLVRFLLRCLLLLSPAC